MKRIIMIGTIVVTLFLLAGGAYAAVQLLAEPETETAVGGSGGGRVMQSVQIGNDGAAVSVQTTILPAAELPDEEAAAFGIVLDRQDDTLTVGTGDLELSVDVEVDPGTGQETTAVVPSTNGPELEIVITRDTLLYREVTDVAGQMPDQSGEVTIMQEIRPVADSSQIETQMEVQVWGERRGGRIVADIVVFGPLAGGAFE
ncbi:MAG: hypothetical protein GY796_30520 [Chloroflexi bacterium]|nr:hypothetical protein [Chloroflexota bacterium]